MTRAAVYIDPGVERCAIAYFADSELVAVWWWLTALGALTAPRIPGAHAVVELPRIRKHGKQAAVRTDDLIRLAAAGGRVAGNMPVRYVWPEEWKGQIPCTCTAKTTPEQCTHHRRMAAALSPAERKIVEHLATRKSLLHNIYDAVTMGLKFEGRLDG